MSIVAGLILLGLAIPIIAIAMLPRRRLLLFKILWPLAIVPLTIAGVIWDSLARGAEPGWGKDTVFLISFVSSFLAIPWILLCLVAYGAGHGLRRQLGVDPSGREGVESAMRKIAADLDIPEQKLPRFDQPDDSGGAHLEHDGKIYRWIVTERGQVLDTRETRSVDDLLFWVFDSLTFSQASSLAAAQPAGRPFADRLRDEQARLLRRIKPGWVRRSARERWEKAGREQA